MASLINSERYSRYYHRLGMMYQRPEIKASVEVIFSVFMVTLLIFVAIRPTLTNLAALQKKISDKESISSKADKKISVLYSAQEQLAEKDPFLPLFLSAVPDKFSYLDIIARIEATAKTAGVEIDSLSVKGVNLIGTGKAVGEWSTKINKIDATGMMVSPVDFQLLGQPNQIKKFLVDIENVDRLGIIKSVNLVKESGTIKGAAKIKANGQIDFYVYSSKK